MWHVDNEDHTFYTEKPVIRKILEHLGLWREEQWRAHNKASPKTEADAVELKEVYMSHAMTAGVS